MNKVNVLVVEDNVEDSTMISEALTELGYHVSGIAQDLAEATLQLETSLPDIVLIDIHLGKTMDGITLAHQIKANEQYQIPFVFLTSARDKATFAAAKSSQPSAYLIKPFNPLELDYALELALENFSESQGELSEGLATLIKDYFYVKHNRSLIKLALANISHVAVSGRYSELYCNDQRFLCRKSLIELTRLFPANNFLRVHRNYLVNREFVKQIVLSEYSVYLTNGKIVPISSRYLESVKTAFPVLS